MKLLDSKPGILLVLMMCALGFFILKRGTSQPELQKARVQALSKVQAPKQAIISAPAKQAPPSALENARKNYNIVVLNGITKVPALVKDEKIRVTIQPKPEAQWCKSGDYDLIKMLAPNTKDKFLTLSLEAIDSDGVKRFQSYNLSDLNADRPVTFEIPSEDGAYGLYLCADQGKKESCAQKQPVPAEIWSTAPNKVKKLGTDKIFYFQLLHVKDKGLHVIPSQAWGKNNLKTLKARLGDWMGDDVSALEKMDSLVAKIQPMPARLSESRIEIPLPYNDMRCLGH